MYKIFMLIALPALVIGWIAYALWERKMREEEKKQPKPESQRSKKDQDRNFRLGAKNGGISAAEN